MKNLYTFTAREYDTETGLYYYRARYYDPVAGRFITRDPIGFEGGINLYAYVGNNPVNWVDPEGLSYDDFPPFGYDPNIIPPEWNPKNWMPKEWKEVSAEAAFAKCTVRCVLKQTGIWGIEHAALHQAAKKLAWEFGKKAVPYVGWVSTAITAGKSAQCFVKCDDDCKN